MSALRIFSRFAELLDVRVSRAAAAWLRLNTDGTVSERTAAQTLTDIGAEALLASKANLSGGNTFSGAQSFSHTSRPTISATTAVQDSSALNLTDFKTENHYTRHLMSMAVGTVSGTGASARRTTAAGVVDGDILTATSAGAFYRIALVGSGGCLQGIPGSCVNLSTRWQFTLRFAVQMPSSNGHLLFCIGGDGTSGVPGSGINVGMEITSQTSVRLWRCNSAAAVYSSAGTIANTDGFLTHDQFFWLACNGAGQLDLYYANKSATAAMPSRPATPICTLTGVAAGLTGATLPSLILRAIASPLGNFSALALRDARFTEF